MHTLELLVSNRVAVTGAVAVTLLGLSHAADAAVIIPASVNETLIAFNGGGGVKDFSGRYWNGDPSTGAAVNNQALTNSLNVSTGISLSESAFDTVNYGGVGASGAAFTVPTGQAATLGYQASTGGWINVNNDYAGKGVFGAFPATPSFTVTLSGLSLTSTYNLTFFGARGGVGDNRDTQFNVSGGAATTTLLLGAANNDQFGNVVTASGVTPNASGVIAVTVADGALNNNNSNADLYYLSTLDIVASPVPEPASMAGLALGGLALVRRRRSA